MVALLSVSWATKGGGTLVNEPWRRRVLYIAGVWNVLGGVSALVDPTRHFSQLYNAALSLGEPLQAFFYRATWINVIAWGIGYILAGRIPTARLPILAAGGAGKVAYFGACLSLCVSGVGNAMLLSAGLVDLVFAACFASVLWSQRSGPPPVG